VKNRPSVAATDFIKFTSLTPVYESLELIGGVGGAITLEDSNARVMRSGTVRQGSVSKNVNGFDQAICRARQKPSLVLVGKSDVARPFS
jgi:hypothetical protein